MYTETIDITTTVLPHGVLEVRTATTTLKDGKSVGTVNHRTTLAPGSDVSDQAPSVQAIAEAAWTPEVVAAWKAMLENLP
jgi:hypothetical protein